MKTESTNNTWTIKSMLPRMCAVCLLALLALFVTGSGIQADAQTLEDFGYNHMQYNGKAAQGSRPLLVILAEFDGYPAMAHDRDYYDNLVFNYFWTRRSRRSRHDRRPRGDARRDERLMRRTILTLGVALFLMSAAARAQSRAYWPAL